MSCWLASCASWEKYGGDLDLQADDTEDDAEDGAEDVCYA